MAGHRSTTIAAMDLFKPLVALLAIVNPVGVVPFFIHFTQSFSAAERRRTIRISAFTAFLVIAVSALAGLKIIEFFGISIASFQVGGGTLLLISALSMLNAKPAESKPGDEDEGRQKVDAGASIAVVPLTIPLLTGPATISTMVIYAERTRQWGTWRCWSATGWSSAWRPSWPSPPRARSPACSAAPAST
jgi:multiple antibiotic resistance protein